MSFNACVLSRVAITDMAHFLELDAPWDFVLLQEFSSEAAFGFIAAGRMRFGWDGDCRASVGELIDVDGHLLLLGSSPWGCNGVFVHRRHCTSIVAHRAGIYPSVTLDTEAGRVTGSPVCQLTC